MKWLTKHPSVQRAVQLKLGLKGCHIYLFLELKVAFKPSPYYDLRMPHARHFQHDRIQNQIKTMMLYNVVSIFWVLYQPEFSRNDAFRSYHSPGNVVYEWLRKRERRFEYLHSWRIKCACSGLLQGSQHTACQVVLHGASWGPPALISSIQFRVSSAGSQLVIATLLHCSEVLGRFISARIDPAVYTPTSASLPWVLCSPKIPSKDSWQLTVHTWTIYVHYDAYFMLFT